MGKALKPEQQTVCRLLRKYFFSRIDIVAARQSWVDRKTKERVARPRPVKGEDSLDELIAFHVVGPDGGKAPPINYTNRKTSGQVADGRGFDRLGSYTVSTDDTAAWLCMDFDGPSAGHSKGTTLADPQATMMVCYERCRELRIPAHIEKSGSGAGWHLWVFFEEPVPAVDARLLGHFIAPTDQPLATGEIADVRIHRGIECFPKQNKVSDKKIGAGNLVWLPFWFGAKDGGNRFHVVDGDGNIGPHEPSEFERFSVADLATILDQMPDDLRNLVLKKRPKRPASKSKTSQKSQGTQSDYPSTDADLIVTSLDSISPDCSYDEWLRIGMALHEWDPQAGLSIWDSWSTRSEKYVAGEPEEKWVGFSSDGGVTLGTLFDMAKKAGWIPPAHERTPLPTDEEIAKFMDIDPAELIEQVKSKKQREILDCLLNASQPLTPKKIAVQIGKDYNSTKVLLHRMAKDGKIHRDDAGGYIFPTDVTQIAPDSVTLPVTSTPNVTADVTQTGSKGYISPSNVTDPVASTPSVTANVTRPTAKNVTGDRPRLPTIIVNNRQGPPVLNEAWGAVRASNYPPRIFQRRGSLVRLVSTDAVPTISTMNFVAVHGHLWRIAKWVVDANDMQVATDPPPKVVADMLEYIDNSLPHLEAVVSTPVFDSQGNLVQAPGYHRDAQLWLHRPPGFTLTDVPEQPTESQISDARSLLLDDLLADFPFTDQSDRAHAVAALLMPFVRRMIQGPTPMHLIESPSPGTGKTLLAKTISKIALADKDAASLPLVRDEGENAKKITSTLSRAPQIILLDNISGGIRSAFLASVLTDTEWSDRLLGSSRIITLPNHALWLATANNPTLTLEIARRCVRIRIDSRHDRPWLLSGFKHSPLDEWIADNRSTLITALLTIIRGWVVAGKKPERVSFGSFDDWARIIGGILKFAAIPGFLDHLEELYEAADHEGNEWREFTAAWWERFGPRYATAAELLGLATEKELLSATIGDKSLQSQKIRIGRALSAMRDRQFDVYRITTRRNSSTKNQTYGLVNVSDGEAQNPASIVDLFSRNAQKNLGESNQPTADSPQRKTQENQDSTVSAVSTVSDSGSAHIHAHTHAQVNQLANSPQTPHSPQTPSGDLADFDPQEEES